MNGKQLLQWAAEQLGAKKRLEAELLLGHILGRNRALLLAHDEEPVTAVQEEKFRSLVARRRRQEPLQYLLGSASFMGMELQVTPEVLIPRFDTEVLVEHCLRLLQPMSEARVADICTGSGAIAISLSRYSQAKEVWATDLSAAALAVAVENNRLQQTTVQFLQGDLLTPFDASFYHFFDLIVSNPPYITSSEIKQLPQDVLQEPMLALWGGADGLYFYRKIIQSAALYLKEGGYLAFETGFTQGAAVQELLYEQGFDEIVLLHDPQGLDRVVSGCKTKKDFRAR